jgi:hypothetical protein
MATKKKYEIETEREPTTDGPLLDLSDDAVKKMIKAAKKRGYVTIDELNSVLPSEEVTSEQIEDTMSMLSDMGIRIEGTLEQITELLPMLHDRAMKQMEDMQSMLSHMGSIFAPRARDSTPAEDEEAGEYDDSSVISLFDIAYAGRDDLAERYIDEYRSQINDIEAGTGLSPLHIAIGRNHLQLVKFLLDQGAIVRPDRQGRWPSTIAELCEVDGEICDLVVDAETRLGM